MTNGVCNNMAMSTIRHRLSSDRFVHTKYTMQNIFGIFCFASLFAHLSSIFNNYNCNDENWILGK